MALLMFLSFLLISSAIADDSFTFLSEGEPAPFEGTLFNPGATAELLVSIDERQLQCDLELEYQLQVQATNFKLEIDNLTASHDTMVAQQQQTILTQQTQIEELNVIIESNSGHSKWLWATAGAVVGAGITYGAYRAFR
jgi:hypothetical protein